MTVLCGGRRLDLAIPATVPCAELMPILLRLLCTSRPGGADEGPDEVADDDGHDAPTAGPPEVVAWQLAVVAGRLIAPTETLRAAGVLHGDLLELRHRSHPQPTRSTGGTVRDLIEDVVTDDARFWTTATTASFLQVASVVLAGALLIPVIGLPLGVGVAGLAGTVAVLVALLAAAMARRSPSACSVVALVVGCSWALLAGIAAFLIWTAAPAGSTPSTAAALVRLVADAGSSPAMPAIAAGSSAALVLAACSVVHHRAALVLTAALAVPAGTSIVLAVVQTSGGPAGPTGCAVAVVAVLALGALPRAALLAGGLTDTGLGDRDVVEARFITSDRLLTGCVIGINLVAVGAAIPSALAGDRLSWLFAGAIGLALLLRSRMFSQIPHAIGPRIAGIVVLAALWWGAYRQASQLQAGLLLLLAITLTAGTVLFAPGGRSGGSPIARARAGRLLGAAEQVTMIALVLLAAGVGGLFEWISRSVG